MSSPETDCKGIYPERGSSTEETEGEEVLEPDIDQKSGKSGTSEHALKQILDALETLLEAAPRSALSTEFVERLRASCLVTERHLKASDPAEGIEGFLNLHYTTQTVTPMPISSRIFHQRFNIPVSFSGDSL